MSRATRVRNRQRRDQQQQRQQRRRTEQPRLRQRPLPDDLTTLDVFRWGWADHSFDQLDERNIGVYEVYATLADPDITEPGGDNPDERVYKRGDVEVVVDERAHTIITVIDRMRALRSTPRVPLYPVALLAIQLDEERQVPAMSKTVGVTDPKAVTSTPQAVALWVAACKSGEEFAVGDVIAMFCPNENFSESAVRQQLIVWAKNDRLRKDGWGAYKVLAAGLRYADELIGSTTAEPEPEQPTARAEVELAPEPTQAAEPAVDPTEPVVLKGTRSTMTLTLTAEWSTPPPRVAAGGEIASTVRDHLLDRLLAQLKERPGEWMQILKIEGGSNPTDLAGKRVTALRKDNPYPQVELVARPIQAGKTAGVWARWAEPTTATGRRAKRG